MRKVTQKQGIFYQLYKQQKQDPEVYIPIWALIGEVYVEELRMWAFVSYEVSARMSEMWQDNPTLFERKEVVGKTGAKYFAYRLRIGVNVDDIKDPKIRSFHKAIRS